MEDRMGLPVVSEGFDGKTLEKLASPAEISVDGGEQQALAEPPGSRQKYILAGFGKAVNEICLVDINVSSLDYLGEGLHSDGIFLSCHDYLIFTQR